MREETRPTGEVRAANPSEFLLMPGITGSERARKNSSKTRDYIHRVPGILDYLSQIPEELMASEFQFKGLIDEVDRFYPSYSARLGGYAVSKMVDETLSETFGDSLTRLTDKRQMGFTKMYKNLRTHLGTTTHDVLCINDNHTITAATLEAVGEESKDKDIVPVVICFDNHPDVFENDEQDKRVFNEGNVFLALVNNGIIAGAAFIGSENPEPVVDYANELCRKAYGEDEGTWFYAIAGHEIRDSKEVGPVNKEKLKNRIAELVKTLKLEGATNVILSVDIDVLNARKLAYTGFYYSPMTLFNKLSTLELPDKQVEELTQEDVRDLFNRFLFGNEDLKKRMKRMGATRDEFIDILTKESFCNPIDQSYRADNFDPKTMMLSDVGVGIDAVIEECGKAGIEIGIKLKNGGRYIGDIAGLEGVDYKGYTARATKALATRIARSAQLGSTPR
jgi:hypothetical protein